MESIGRNTLEIMKTADWYNRWLFSFVKPYLAGEVLEVGAGIGNFTRLLKEANTVVAIDIEETYVKKLKKLKGNVLVGLGDIEKGRYFFDKRLFDSLVCLNVLEHIKDDKKALMNMYKLLKPGGRLILLVPAHELFYGGLDKELGHFRRYSKKELVEKIKKVGFDVERARYLNWLGGLGWFFNARVLKRKILPKNQLALFDKLSGPILLVEKVIEPPFGLSVFVVAIK